MIIICTNAMKRIQTSLIFEHCISIFIPQALNRFSAQLQPLLRCWTVSNRFGPPSYNAIFPAVVWMCHLVELSWDYVTHASQKDFLTKCWLNIKNVWSRGYCQGISDYPLACVFTQADWIIGWLWKNSKLRWCKILNMLFPLEMGIVQPTLRQWAKVFKIFSQGQCWCVYF